MTKIKKEEIQQSLKRKLIKLLNPGNIITFRKKLKLKKIKKIKRKSKKNSIKIKNIKKHSNSLKYFTNYEKPIFNFIESKREPEKENLNENNLKDIKKEIKNNISCEEKKPNEITSIINNINGPKINKVEEKNIFSSILNIKDNSAKNNNINNIVKEQNLSDNNDRIIFNSPIESCKYIDFNDSNSYNDKKEFAFPIVLPLISPLKENIDNRKNDINLLLTPQERIELNNAKTPKSQLNIPNLFYSSNQEINSNLNKESKSFINNFRNENNDRFLGPTNNYNRSFERVNNYKNNNDNINRNKEIIINNIPNNNNVRNLNFFTDSINLNSNRNLYNYFNSNDNTNRNNSNNINNNFFIHNINLSDNLFNRTINNSRNNENIISPFRPFSSIKNNLIIKSIKENLTKTKIKKAKNLEDNKKSCIICLDYFKEIEK